MCRNINQKVATSLAAVCEEPEFPIPYIQVPGKLTKSAMS